MALDARSFKERLENGNYSTRTFADAAVKRSQMSPIAKRAYFAMVEAYFEDDVAPPRKMAPPPSQSLFAQGGAGVRHLPARVARPAPPKPLPKPAPPSSSTTRLAALEKARATLAAKRAQAKAEGARDFPPPSTPSVASPSESSSRLVDFLNADDRRL